MIDLVDPVQRNIHAIVVRDAIVRDDAADIVLVNASPKQIGRQLRAMLHGVDFVGEPMQAALDDPPGRRVGRVAFNASFGALWVRGRWTGSGPAPHRLPESQDEITAFILQQTNLGRAANEVASDLQVSSLFDFETEDHARNSDLLRMNGAGAQLFIAASMLSAACSRYEKAMKIATETGRKRAAVDVAAHSVEAALICTARIAAEALLNRRGALPRVGRVAMHLANQVELFRRTRAREDVRKAVRGAATAAAGVHRYLTRGIVHDIPLETDRDPMRLRDRLKVANIALETAVAAMLDEVEAVDAYQLYVLLMARRLDVALARHPWLAAPHPIFRLNYAYIGGHAMFAEFERLGLLIITMARRQRQNDGTTLDSVTLKPALAKPQVTQAAIGLQTAAGRYLDLGVYHRAVMTSFIRREAHWRSATVPFYTHHAYAIGSRVCDLAAAAGDPSTHDFIRQSEYDKPTQRGTKKQGLVFFFGLDIEETVILALRQILDRVPDPGVGTFTRNIAFGLTVRRILLHTAPSIAARLNMTSRLENEEACGKGLANRATRLARQFDDRDYHRPCGVTFDFALWFDRDRDIPFWDRLQKAAKLYTKFGSSFIAGPPPAELEALPGRKGRRATRAGDPPSRWRQIMVEAKQAFDAYQLLYLKGRPTRLTARIMARMNQGYSAFASDPQFRTLFRS
jgi:hypothetical protein